MLADQLTGKDTLSLVIVKNRIIALFSHVMLCSDHFALVFVQCPPPGPRLSFESREEGAGGDIPLQNCESVSAVHILNPLCQCYIHVHKFKEFHSRVQIHTASFYGFNVSKQ